ncbi:hypothetical protein BKA61DRAFT_684684 [Leptodontidium sp. MPI-SDFR-AT-0119]|nr:hypothetical protein BKA61DRAFT_684684 [Leptodontidium sp. MPI-SDFR-AT-0119]
MASSIVSTDSGHYFLHITFVIAICLSIDIGLYQIGLRKRSSLYIKVEEKALLGFSDQILITGFGLQIAGFIKLKQLSFYHQAVITYLATLSTSCHSLCVIILHEYFHKHALARQIRIGVMTINFGFIQSGPAGGTTGGTSERSWGYGQITPLLFLLLPILNALSIYSEEYEAQKRPSAVPNADHDTQSGSTQTSGIPTGSSNTGTGNLRRRDTEAQIREHIEMSTMAPKDRSREETSKRVVVREARSKDFGASPRYSACFEGCDVGATLWQVGLDIEMTTWSFGC